MSSVCKTAWRTEEYCMHDSVESAVCKTAWRTVEYRMQGSMLIESNKKGSKRNCWG